MSETPHTLSPKPTRWKIVIEYDGTHFHGWQKQDNVPTIQTAIEDALYKFTGEPIKITGSGRTDAGVHAFAQIAHFDLLYRYQSPKRQGELRALEPFELVNALNACLRPHAVSVLSAHVMDDDFHARFTAKNKLYRYRIIARKSPLAIDKTRAWHVPHTLDIKNMQDACKHLIGHHDFSTFRDAECQSKSPMRTLDALAVKAQEYGHGAGQEIHIEAQAQSFLHHMVRNIAGTLLLIGEGKWNADDVVHALKAKDRTQGGPTAPPQGLYLMRVDYT